MEKEEKGEKRGKVKMNKQEGRKSFREHMFSTYEKIFIWDVAAAAIRKTYV